MEKFRKLVAIEPVGLEPDARRALRSYAEEVVEYDGIPADDEEIVSRIGDADAVLLSWTSSINARVIDRCPGIRYIGMCCSLYSPESANVDIAAAEKKGISVTGIRDYGDEGVVEYVIAELVACLHGFGGQKPWFGRPSEITGLKAGIERPPGMGVKGDDTRLDAAALCLGGQLFEQVAVAAMDAVEKSDGRHAGLRRTGMGFVDYIHR